MVALVELHLHQYLLETFADQEWTDLSSARPNKYIRSSSSILHLGASYEVKLQFVAFFRLVVNIVHWSWKLELIKSQINVWVENLSIVEGTRGDGSSKVAVLLPPFECVLLAQDCTFECRIQMRQEKENKKCHPLTVYKPYFKNVKTLMWKRTLKRFIWIHGSSPQKIAVAQSSLRFSNTSCKRKNMDISHPSLTNYVTLEVSQENDLFAVHRGFLAK